MADQKIRYVDMTPTFQEAVAICIAVIECSNNGDAIAKAKAELMRYGKCLDDMKAQDEAAA